MKSFMSFSSLFNLHLNIEESIISLLSKDILFLNGVNLPFSNLKKQREDFLLFIFDLLIIKVNNVVTIFSLSNSFSFSLSLFSISISIISFFSSLL